MFRRIRYTLLGWAIGRMTEAVYVDNIARTGTPSGGLNANPEDFEDLAWVMLLGLFGLKPKRGKNF